MRRWDTAVLSEIETVPGREPCSGHPVRRYFGVAAFGLNASVAHEPGQDVVERHTEQVRQHEELYVVVAQGVTDAAFDALRADPRFPAAPV